MSFVDPFAKKEVPVDTSYGQLWQYPGESVLNYFFGSVYYLKQINFKMCLYKWQDGIPIFSKKLVFSKKGQKKEILRICPVLKYVFYFFVIFFISSNIFSILDFFFTEGGIIRVFWAACRDVVFWTITARDVAAVLGRRNPDVAANGVKNCRIVSSHTVQISVSYVLSAKQTYIP